MLRVYGGSVGRHHLPSFVKDTFCYLKFRLPFTLLKFFLIATMIKLDFMMLLAWIFSSLSTTRVVGEISESFHQLSCPGHH